MTTENTVTPVSEPIDILSILEQAEALDADISAEEILEVIAEESIAHETVVSDRANDTSVTSLSRLHQAVLPKVKFSLYYVGISSVVFVILLGITNWTSYSMLLSAYINPDALKASNAEILSMLDKSKITVYADNNEQDQAAERARLKEKLVSNNAALQENILSPKRLIPTETKMNIDLEVTPYDNRIIIPKIGKNVPLVDVGINSGFDFEHIENIFMKELEKGVVRYPGTAKPGEEGNAFIFGHSSNYPWMKGEYNSIFALLDELSFGDEIIVYYNQKKYVYRINEKKVIKPGNVKVLNRDPNKKELSLMTCWPLGTTINRLIVFAELEKTSDTTIGTGITNQ